MNQADGLQDIGEEAEEENADNNPQEDSRLQEEETQILYTGLAFLRSPRRPLRCLIHHLHFRILRVLMFIRPWEMGVVWRLTKDLPPSLNHHRSRESSRSSVSTYMRSILGQVLGLHLYDVVILTTRSTQSIDLSRRGISLEHL